MGPRWKILAMTLVLMFVGGRFSTGAPPNVLVILADDLGWRDTGFAGHDAIDTPALDALARAGMVFASAYASAPNCAPTRACLLTGQYTPRHGIYTVVDERHLPGSPHHRILATASGSELSSGVITIAELLRDAGYATAMVGMWNLGRGRSGPGSPSGQGFDFVRQPKELGFGQDEYRDAEDRELTMVLAQEAAAFIREHRNKPWFCYFAPHAVHAPYDPPADLLEKYQERARIRPDIHPAHAATVESLDRAAGVLLKELEQDGLSTNTLVVFTSDNGGERDTVAPLRGGKGSVYEGGLRVPLVIRGPGVKAGSRSDPVLSMDLYPTIARYAGLAPVAGQPVDGESLIPLLEDRGALRRSSVFWHFPCYVGRNGPASVVRRGNLKLIEHFETASVELFDLHEDPTESHDLASVRPEVTRALLAELRRWQESMGAPRPVMPNPAFDSQASIPRQRAPRNEDRPVVDVRPHQAKRYP